MDSITNTPKPVTEKEGFYQCVEMPRVEEGGYDGRRGSVSSVSSLSTITTTYSEEFEGSETVTPESSPGRRVVGRLGEKEMEGERLGVRVSRVGVAF